MVCMSSRRRSSASASYSAAYRLQAFKGHCEGTRSKSFGLISDISIAGLASFDMFVETPSKFKTAARNVNEKRGQTAARTTHEGQDETRQQRQMNERGEQQSRNRRGDQLHDLN